MVQHGRLGVSLISMGAGESASSGAVFLDIQLVGEWQDRNLKILFIKVMDCMYVRIRTCECTRMLCSPVLSRRNAPQKL